MRHLLTISDLDRADVEAILDIADHMSQINQRPNPKVPALRGRTVCNAFFEDSTRTRLSFEMAARHLSADTMTFSASSSSLNKGESLEDTVRTLDAMGVDAFVVRHRSSGVPELVTRWTSACVISAGDGWHAHPTQGLLDCYSILSALGGEERRRGLDGVRIGMIGDIRHSRVARSTIAAARLLGAEVTIVAPSTLLPPAPEVLGATVVHDLDTVIEQFDIVYLLRMQQERTTEALVPSLHEYTQRYGLTPERVHRLSPGALVMHPGPMNRGVEITVDPSTLHGSIIDLQVSSGVAVRMAVLFHLLATGTAENTSDSNERDIP